MNDSLVNGHLPLLNKIARGMSFRTPLSIDECVSAGFFGLSDAVGSFDPSRGVDFEVWAGKRIRGAIKDELRRMDHLSRGERKKVKDGGPEPEIISMDAVRGFDLSSDPDIFKKLCFNEVAGAIEKLPERDQQIISMRFFDDLNFREIGAVFTISESAANIACGKAVLKLKGILSGRPLKHRKDRSPQTQRVGKGNPYPKTKFFTASTLNLKELKKLAVAEALKRTGGNKERAAELLGVSSRTLRKNQNGKV